MALSFSNIHWPRMLLTPIMAIALTVFIFWAMQALITRGGSTLNETNNGAFVNFIHVEQDDDVQTKDRKVKRPPPPPKEPPKPEMKQQQVNQTQNNLDGMNIGAIDIDMNLDSGLGGISTGDGEYLPIIKVAPMYPRSAAQRGIEGFVVLEFTVTELGTVKDPKVINAEPPGIFNRAAMDAVKKFKYKPKMVDGKAIAVSGIKNIIRFELEDQ